MTGIVPNGANRHIFHGDSGRAATPAVDGNGPKRRMGERCMTVSKLDGFNDFRLKLAR